MKKRREGILVGDGADDENPMHAATPTVVMLWIKSKQILQV